MDTGWKRWLPAALVDVLQALDASDSRRRRAFAALADPADPKALADWERFRLVAPSRLDLPVLPSDLDAEQVVALLEELGLVAGVPPLRMSHPDPVETVLTLDHEEVRALEQLRAATDNDPITTLVSDLPTIDARFGGTKVGRNDPCPCGSGRKFKKCHGG